MVVTIKTTRDQDELLVELCHLLDIDTFSELFLETLSSYKSFKEVTFDFHEVKKENLIGLYNAKASINSMLDLNEFPNLDKKLVRKLSQFIINIRFEVDKVLERTEGCPKVCNVDI